MLHAVKFKHCLWPKVWGGRRLQHVLGIPLPDDQRIGEGWGLYDFPPGLINGNGQRFSAQVACGPLGGLTLGDLIGRYGQAVHGPVRLLPDDQFPLVVKFLDASDTLSVQVHPHKNEAWYIVHADPGAVIYLGFRRGVERKDVEKALADQTLTELLNTLPVRAGQCFYIPRGTVHALGAGILAAEVQTPSPVVYRLYDWGRHENGRPRELHIDEALACIDYSAGGGPVRPAGHMGTPVATVSELLQCPFFSLRRIQCSEGYRRTVCADGMPVVWIWLKGQATVAAAGAAEPLCLVPGDVVLLPAGAREHTFEARTDCTWLESTMPAADAPSSAR